MEDCAARAWVEGARGCAGMVLKSRAKDAARVREALALASHKVNFSAFARLVRVGHRFAWTLRLCKHLTCAWDSRSECLTRQ